MKRILLIYLLAAGATHAQEAPTNGGMPVNFPPTIQVARVPLGS